MATERTASTISISWFYEMRSITLTPRNWARVKAGKELNIRGKGLHAEGEFFWDHWHFGGGLEGKLFVSYGDSGAVAFDGRLNEVRVTEHKWRGCQEEWCVEGLAISGHDR